MPTLPGEVGAAGCRHVAIELKVARERAAREGEVVERGNLGSGEIRVRDRYAGEVADVARCCDRVGRTVAQGDVCRGVVALP
jgi:hypothetical protein